MNLLGKILVVIVFLMTVVLGGLIALLYDRVTNWHDAYQQLQSRYQGLDAQYTALTKEKEDNERKLLQEKQDEGNKRAEIEGKLATAQRELKALTDKLNTRTAERDMGTANMERSVSSKEQFQRELAQQEQRINTLLADLQKAIYEKDQLHQQKVEAEVRERGYRAKSESLEIELRELARAMEQMRSGVAGVTTAKPQQHVEGLVSRTDGDRLVTITIGSDSGIAKGHTLEIFRFDPNPRNSKYLGRLKILDVREKEAVGEVEKRSAGMIRVGDRVATSIIRS